MVDAWIICAAVALVLVLVFLYPSEWSWGAGVVAVVAGAGAVYLMPEGMMGGEENSGQRAKTAYEMTFSGSDEYGEDYMNGSNEYGEYDDEYFMGGGPHGQRGPRPPRHPATKPFTIGLRPNLFEYLKDGSRTIEIRRGDKQMWERHIGHVIAVKKSLAEERQNIKIEAVEHFDTLDKALAQYAKELGGGKNNKAVVEDLKEFFSQEKMPESGAAGTKYAGGVNVIKFVKTNAAAPNFTWE